MQTLLALLATLMAAPSDNPNPWRHSNTTDNVRVYVRDVPDSAVREVKSTSLIPAKPERVFEVLLDLDNYVHFMPYVEEARRLEKIDEHSFYGYQRLNPPLVSRRDYTLRYTVSADPENNHYRLSWDEAPDKGPQPIRGVVRLEICQGWWSLEADNGGKATRATYWLYTHPGGSIPAWIANRANTSSLPELHRALRERSLNPNWTND